MSIHVGLVPLLQDSNDVFSIYSNRSNIIRFVSPSNNAILDFGEYKLGNRSNSDFMFSHNNSNIITFNSNAIYFNREINTKGDLKIVGALNISNDIITPNTIKCGVIDTQRIILKNSSSTGEKVIDCSSNSIETFNIMNESNGVGFIGGRLGIGTHSVNNEYSLITDSNIFIDGYVASSAVNTSIINASDKTGQIVIGENTILIDAQNVIVKNLNLAGANRFQNITCDNFADMRGLLLNSNLSIYNRSITENPFKINQRLILGGFLNNIQQYGNPIFGNPISVHSQHINQAPDPTIFELSSCGHVVLGDYPTLGSGAIINDYMIRGLIPTNRERHFKGYLHFSSNTSAKTIFNVNKSGQLSIGTTTTNALLDIVNGFDGSEQGYIKPSSIALLENATTENRLPFMKCVTSSETKFHITSNGTLCFTNDPIDIDRYTIESESNYLPNIETNTITNLNGLLDMSFLTMSNIQTLLTSNINSEDASISYLSANNIQSTDAYIDRLRVGTFSTGGLDQGDTDNTFAIGSDRLFFKGKNIIISKNQNVIDAPPSEVNLETDKLIIQTETSTGNVNGYTIYGTNRSIKMYCKNNSATVNSFVAHELNNSNGGFAILSKVVNTPLPELHITPILSSTDGSDPYTNPAIVLKYNKDVYFNASSHINNVGSLFIRTTNTTIDSITSKSVNIGDGVVVFSTNTTDTQRRFACINTNSYGSVDIGRGITTATKGPFFKQGGWMPVVNGIYTISDIDYGGSTYTSGTLHIQVQTGTTQIANTSLSFLRLAGVAEIFNIVTHRIPSTMKLIITANTSGIRIETDANSTVCWTSIGSR